MSLYTFAAAFVCPSVCEPLGIINLEAMACETPGMASAVGGIPEVVVPGGTGLSVPFEPISVMDTGAQLGWSIDPSERRVYVYRSQRQPECLDTPSPVSGDPVLAGFVLNLQPIWQPDP